MMEVMGVISGCTVPLICWNGFVRAAQISSLTHSGACWLSDVLLTKLDTISAYTRQKAMSTYRSSIRLEIASQKQSTNTHKSPYARAKRCRGRKINIQEPGRVNVDVDFKSIHFTVNSLYVRDAGTVVNSFPRQIPSTRFSAVTRERRDIKTALNFGVLGSR
ncbi:hypothetical protein PR048_024437 [Dryococelus australis]|uniref:Uncharacterized protein n=1 Tax=Dryococelus australis TaxID=614101 RepID=A0ABQ9GNL8_9NEOP|nr:hypothetical protein PR048_024437 [Dryococelus australis]